MSKVDKDTWEQEVVDAVIASNEHLAYAIDLILQQLKATP